MAQNGTQKGDGPLIAALAGGATVRAAAKKAGIGERTAWRRLEDPGFKKRVAEARGEMLARAVGQLAESATEAVGTLRRLLKAKGESVRLAAARSVLDAALRLREHVELAERVEALEATSQERKDA